MGLDMYLTKRNYIGGNYEHNEVHGTLAIIKSGNILPIRLNRVTYIIEDVGYWRKANQIHSWFVKNVQNGEDDCGDYYVEHEKLTELLAACKAVLADLQNAPGVLPTQAGFFFGSTEYDEYYKQDIEDTIAIIEPLLAELEVDKANGQYPDIYYHSSW